MDPISTVASCVSALQKVYDVRKQLKGNYEDCGRLLDRCELFKPNLDKIQSTPSLYDLSCEPQFATLLATLNDTVEFARQFLEPTLIQRATRFLFRNTRAAEISALTVRINSCLQDLNFAFQGHMMRDVRDVKELISGKGAFGVVSTGPPSPSSPNEAGFQTDIEKTDGAHVRQQNINEVQSIETNNRLSIAAVVPKLLSQVAVVSEHSNTSALQDSDVNVLYRIRPQGRMASNMTALMIACHLGSVALVKVLLSVPHIRTNFQDEKGWTALMEACRDGHTETVETLLAEATVDVNIANEDGWTALVHAVYGGHTDTVRVLLGDNRVKVNEKTNDGRTALDWARDRKKVEIEAMLKGKGASGKWKLW